MPFHFSDDEELAGDWDKSKERQAAADEDSLVGTIAGTKYRIISRIGGGGMGVVYRGEHIFIGRPVAIKVVSPRLMGSEKYENMLRQEAMLASRFNHPNAVMLHDFGFLEDGKTFYLVMEFLGGRTLRRELNKLGVILEERVINIMRQVASAMAAAHRNKIVHLDLKPNNIMLLDSPVEGKDVVKVLDFGVSRFTGAHAQASVSGLEKDLTRPERVLGTLRYMSPEQIVGENVDERSDVFSLGTIMYEMLTGRYPFEAKTKRKLIQNIIQTDPRRFRRIAPHLKISEAMEKVVFAAMEKDAADRFSSANELLVAIEKASVEREAARLQVGLAAQKAPATPADFSLAQKVIIFLRNKLLKRRAKLPEEIETPEGMAFVPGGEFQMGADIGSADEAPLHSRQLEPFYIDKYPVTNRQYKKFIEATSQGPPANWKTVTFPAGMADHPVTHISWFDAQNYCQWAGKRLPTEEEWEKASRGIDGRTYPWGNHWKQNICNWAGVAGPEGPATSPVGYFKVDCSPSGCYDMAGNVKEWVNDWYEKYFLSSFIHEDFGQKFKVLRGGGCETKDPKALRVSKRSRARPHERGPWGFRCAMSLATFRTIRKV